MNQNTIQDLFEQAQNDPTLRNTLCVKELLEQIGAENRPHFAEKTLHEITEEVVETLTDLGVYSPEFIEKSGRSLLEYQHIDAIHKFQNGRLLRWLRIHPLELDETKAKIKSGALCTGVKFHNNGAYIQCVSANGKRFFQLKYDDHLFYQKLSPEEQMVLALNQYVSDK